jgi:ABC-type branched-subunit amino acid transport system substrate-binding protein
MKSLVMSAVMAIVSGCLTLVSGAEDGVSETQILVGQCAALKGSIASLGTSMKEGIEACFAACNAAGGVHGRTLKLISVDDSYDPDKTVDGTLKLIDDEKVFSLIGYVGTPTSKVALPIVEEKKVPLVGLFTGAMLLRQPVSHYVVNIRASYDDETEALVEHLAGERHIQRIGVFYQDDSFGRAGMAGVRKALEKRHLQIVGEGKYARNTLAVKSGLSSLMNSRPDAIIIVAPYQPAAAFIKAAADINFAPAFATISFVGTESLIRELGPLAENVIISQVVPSPECPDLPVASDFREALNKYQPGAEPTFAALEGYISARIYVHALQQAGRDLTREGVIQALEKMTSEEIGGLHVSFGPDDHQALNQVFLTTVSHGRAVDHQRARILKP